MPEKHRAKKNTRYKDKPKGCWDVRLQVGDAYVEFCFGFAQSLKVCTIHEKHDAVNGREVVFPHSAGCKHRNQSHCADGAGGIISGANLNAMNPPCAWPPRSKVVKVMPAILSSSEAAGIKAKLNSALLGMLVSV